MMTITVLPRWNEDIFALTQRCEKRRNEKEQRAIDRSYFSMTPYENFNARNPYDVSQLSRLTETLPPENATQRISHENHEHEEKN